MMMYLLGIAELNAILQSNRRDLIGTTLYVTLFPCNECAKAIIQAGIKKVIYLREYKHTDLVKITQTMFDAAGVECVKYNPELDITKEEQIYQKNNISTKELLSNLLKKMIEHKLSKLEKRNIGL